MHATEATPRQQEEEEQANAERQGVVHAVGVDEQDEASNGGDEAPNAKIAIGLEELLDFCELLPKERREGTTLTLKRLSWRKQV